MAKPKVDFKQLLLDKGEWIALGVAGLGLVVLLLMGMSAPAPAGTPEQISKDFAQKSSNILSRINAPETSETIPPLPEAVRPGKSNPYTPVEPYQFASDTVLFDSVGRPDIKRENPKVLPIEDYQIDLVRGAMPGFDITYVNGEQLIAVRVEKKLSAADKEKLKGQFEKLTNKVRKGAEVRRDAPPPAAPPGPGVPPGPGRPPGVGGSGGGPPPLGGSGGGPPPLGGGFGFGGPAGAATGAEQRTEVGIFYIPIDDLDKAAGENKLPAQTVIPLRLVVVNFTIPLKKQMEEMKRALRLATVDQARDVVRFDGFEVQRKVTQQRANGDVVVVQDWAKYDYESKFVDMIYSRKLRDHVEGGENTKEGKYLPYFYRYEDSLVMPLPELVSELSAYPPIKIKSVLDTIDKLAQAAAPKIEPSKVLDRVRGKNGSRKIWGNPNGLEDTGGQLFNPGAGGPMGNAPLSPPKGGVGPGLGAGGTLETQAAGVDIDQLLGRFIDCDAQPGLSYEYQIRLRMVNPNFGSQNLPNVSNPNDTKKQVLYGPWVPTPGSIQVPAEDFLFASDRAAYTQEIQAAYKDQKNLLKVLEAKDSQAVVQAVKWMESIRMEGKHEPIGGWVVADMPVSRGEYIGKRTFVKLPLWSSERNEYVFREIAAGAVKGANQPKGWLVDFSSKSILVDFEGGKLSPRVGNRSLPNEEAATEMLIVRADGKLLVRRSDKDAGDENRAQLTGMWDAWLKKVETRPAAATGTGENNPFERDPKK